MVVLEQVKALLNNVLQLDGRAGAWNENTALLGNVPELDSMAVVSVITALEEEFGVVIEDDDINADVFATLGALARFVEERLPA